MKLSIKNLYNYDYIHHMTALYKTFFIRYRVHIKQRSMRPITKFIRANLMLDWIERNFKAKIVFVVRHPGAVAASRINAAKFKGGVDWDFKGMCMQKILSQYKRDENLRKEFLDKYYEIFSNKLSNVEGQTLLWCIENIMPVYRLQRKNRYVFFYEDLVKNPNTEFEKMIKILGLKRKNNRSSIFKPSQKVFDQSQLTRWMKTFDQQQFSEIDSILKFFNVTIYNAFEPMPVKRIQVSI